MTTRLSAPDTSLPPSLDNDAINDLLAEIASQAAESDVEGDFPVDSFAALAEVGLLSVTLPGQALDGSTVNTPGLLQLLKRIGGANLAVGRVYEGHINALHLIHLVASNAQKRGWFAEAQDHRLFSVWNTQANDGVRIHAVGNGRYVLEGCKTFCSGAGWINRPLVTGELMDGQTARGWQVCIIPTEQVQPIPQDDSFWKPLGMRASASFKMDFTGVELTDDDLLGQPGDYYQQPHFSGGAIRFAAVQLGGAESLFEHTRQFLRDLNRTGDPFQKARLAEMAWLVESGNQWINSAAQKTDQWFLEKTDPAKTVTYANMTRTAIEGICTRVMQLTEQAVGARGLLRPLPFERIIRDLTLYLRQPAPDATIQDIGAYVSTHSETAHDLWH
ncbi:MAG: acyl-CoA dehydrogenase family protein [Rudanella sp.]|nr:acyl-CoA dehydrogenase family protein [Rudanella sp.]